MPKGVYKHIHIPWNKGLKVRLNPKGEFKKGFIPWNKGKRHTEETKRKVSETKRNQHRKMTDLEKKKLSEYNKKIGRRPPVLKGEKNLNWQGGKSFEKYPIDWCKSLRIAIRERDRYTCQMCAEKQDNEALSVHHIDYNKQNCNPINLISLCRLCHGKTAKNRNYWINYFKVWQNNFIKTLPQQEKYFH